MTRVRNSKPDCVVPLDPMPGDVWDAQDGGSLYVVARSALMVQVQRRPFGDSQSEPYWTRLQTFQRDAVSRSRRRLPGQRKAITVERLADGRDHVRVRIATLHPKLRKADLVCGHRVDYVTRFRGIDQVTMLCPICTADLRARGGAA